jgi:hypothetical protein
MRGQNRLCTPPREGGVQIMYTRVSKCRIDKNKIKKKKVISKDWG